MTPARFPHSDTPGSTLGCQLPRAYRRLLRPSSALDAKASTMCPSQLVTHTTNPTGPPTRRPPTSGPHTQESKPEPAVHTTHHKKHQHTRHNHNGCINKQQADPGKPRAHKMLASTIQISNNNPTPRRRPTTRHRPGRATP